MRLVIVLAVAAAATVMLGVILVAVDVAMRLVTKRQPANMARLGLDVVAVGIAFGLMVLVVFVIARIGSAAGSRSPGSTADHRRGSSRPRPAASGGPGQPPGHGRAREQSHREQGQERLRAGAPPTGGGRSARSSVLNPTHVYTPGGLIDVPRDGRAPGTPGGQDIPEILRTAGPGGGRGQDRPPSAWPGPHPPHPGYQQGMNPGGPGRGPYAPGGQPPPMPPREHMRSREAPRPAHGMPPREPMPPRGGGGSQKPQPPRPGQAGPQRESRLLRDAGPPREGMGPGGPVRPGGPMPPRDAAYPAPPGQGPGQGPRQAPGQGSGPGRHAGGSGYAAPGGYRPGPAGSPRQGEAGEEFDGGYAKVIRASEHPVRPSGPARPSAPGRLSDPARSAPPADVYVYRDTEGLPGDLGSPAPGPDQNDPAYWYDLPGAGSAGSGAPGRPGDFSGPGGSGGAGGDNRYGPDEPRGPFEPLVSSADPPGTTPRASASADAPPIPGEPPPDPAHPAGPGPADGEGQPGTDRARKLEQIKDLYLTAEAIGEANVDKHFDRLLAQQRELISDYFKQSGTARPADQAEAEPGTPGPGTPGPGDTGAPVAADQPRAW